MGRVLACDHGKVCPRLRGPDCAECTWTERAMLVLNSVFREADRLEREDPTRAQGRALRRRGADAAERLMDRGRRREGKARAMTRARFMADASAYVEAVRSGELTLAVVRARLTLLEIAVFGPPLPRGQHCVLCAPVTGRCLDRHCYCHSGGEEAR